LSPAARAIPREKKSYALFLRDEDTGDVILDMTNIPEHVVQHVALLVGRLMPAASAAKAGVQAVRAMQAAKAGIDSAIENVADALRPLMGPAKRTRGRR
jgi:hypothetical protein